MNLKLKLLVTSAIVAVTVAFSTVSLAADPTIDFSGVNSTLQGSFSAIANNLIDMIGTVLPLGLMVMGMSVAIGFSVKFFKKLTK